MFDCAAVPATLIESELFGHERGAFTGAEPKRVGALREAHGGTLFLDEIGELPLELQPKLLRVLEKREIRRVGGSARCCRSTCASSRRPTAIWCARSTAARFREDLYYRLAVVRVRVPPLREREDDVPLLVEHFVRESLDGDEAATKEAIASIPRRTGSGSCRIRGRATCASCATSSSAPWPSPAASTPTTRR